MDQEDNRPPPSSATDLTRALLVLYECIVDEAHVEQMILMVGSWLSDADEPYYVLQLEEHARKILDDVERRLVAAAPEGDTAQFEGASLGETMRERIEKELGILFDDADWLEFCRREIGDEASPMIIRYYEAGARADLGLISASRVDNLVQVDVKRGDVGVSQALEDLLRKDMRLSDAELRVVKLAVLGFSPEEIAERLNRSRETVRSQLKSVTGKLALSGQLQLTAALRKLELNLPAPRSERSASSDDTLYQGSAAVLQFDVFGDQRARPILFFHCFLHGRHLPLSILPTLNENNVCIWSPSRPGFGKSRWLQQPKGPLIDDLADAFAEFVRDNGLGKVDLLAHATGFGVAYSFAHRYPELSGRLIGLDPAPPASSLRNISSYQGLFRAIALAMYRTPVTFRLMQRFVLKRLEGFRSAKKQMRRHILYPTVPLETLETAAGIDAMTLNVRDLIEQDLKGCVEEAFSYKTDWATIDQNLNTQPSCVVVHTRDNPFVSRAGSQRFAEAIGADFRESPETFPFLSPQLCRLITSKGFGSPGGRF